MQFKNAGFTLIELVIVIIVLSAIGIATSSYISTGVSIYSDISERDKGLNSTRFVMERLRRDLLNALPNSLIVSTDQQCLTFTPILYSSVYSHDFPIAPLEASSATITSITNYSHAVGTKAVVYLLAANEPDKVHEVASIIGEQITFSESVSFPLSSPSKRLYIINATQAYYFSVNQLILANECYVAGSIMADNINGEFEIDEATLQRNGLAKVTFMLNFDGQEVPIEQTLHVTNVP